MTLSETRLPTQYAVWAGQFGHGTKFKLHCMYALQCSDVAEHVM